MTLLKNSNTKELEQRKDIFLKQNKEYLNQGEWSKYSFNCKRIAKITSELNRRKKDKKGDLLIT